MQPEETFERLLAAMPRIADAVNRFTDEGVRRTAFDVLVAALDAPATSPEESLAPPVIADVMVAEGYPLGSMARPAINGDGVRNGSDPAAIDLLT